MAASIKWGKLNEVVLECGSVHEPKSFGIKVIEQVKELVPFDQGRVYYLNDNMKVYDEYLVGVDKDITKAYHEYYSQIDGGYYSAAKRISRFREKYPIIEDWSQEKRSDRFLSEHLYPQGIHYSTGFVILDLYGMPKLLFCMDRTGHTNYSQEDVETLYYLGRHLNNLFANFYVTLPNENGNIWTKIEADLPLTKRECEIAELLLEGVSPKNIAERLYISVATVYTHIARIHTKLHVSSRQELLIKLIDQHDRQPEQ